MLPPCDHQQRLIPMPDQKQPVPRLFILGLALVGGMLLSVVAQVALMHFGLDLGALWRSMSIPRSAQLRAAFAWWLIAGITFVGGFVIGALTKYFSAHPISSNRVRWAAGVAMTAIFVYVAHEAVAPTGLSPAASVGIGLAVQCLSGVLALLGAFFVVRR